MKAQNPVGLIGRNINLVPKYTIIKGFDRNKNLKVQKYTSRENMYFLNEKYRNLSFKIISVR